MNRWLSIGSGWGTREQAIPGEWAMLMLAIVLGGALGLAVLWFTLLRHERTLRGRASGRAARAREREQEQEQEWEQDGGHPEGLAVAGIGSAADEPVSEPEPVDAEVPAEIPEEVPEAAPIGEIEPSEPVEAAAEIEEDSPKLTGATAQRKLTDEILSRVESELAERGAPRWKEMALLVQDEFGVSVHPSSIQKAVKRRRRAEATQTA